MGAPEPLKTRHVFLDTQVFVAEDFYFGTKKLAEISTLGAAGKVHLLMTEITVSECKNQIRKRVAEAMNALRKKGDILRNCPAMAAGFEKANKEKFAKE